MNVQQSGISSPARQNTASQNLSFAKALNKTELEQNLNTGQTAGLDQNKFFSDALSKTGGSLPDAFGNSASDLQQQTEYQQQVEKQKKDQLRRKLHEQINPVEAVSVYNVRHIQVKKEIDDIRQELKLLVNDIKNVVKEAELTLMTTVVDPKDGKYYLMFFAKLRELITLMRQHVRSANSWATQLHDKRSKRAKKTGPGLEVGGQGHEKTSTVQDMINNSELGSTYQNG